MVYSLILLLYRDPGSIRIIFTDPDPDPHHWLKWGKGNHLISYIKDFKNRLILILKKKPLLNVIDQNIISNLMK